MKTIVIAVSVLLVLIIIVTAVEYNRPKPINWSQTYSRYDKIPYGTFIFRDMVEKLYPGTICLNNNEPPYVSLEPYLEDDGYKNQSGNLYIAVSNSFIPDSFDTDHILSFVSRGNTALIAAYYFSGDFTDTLGFEETYIWEGNDSTQSKEHFVNRHLKHTSDYYFRKGIVVRGFDKIDTANAHVIAVDDDNRPTILKYNIGNGSMIICSNPVAFTNYTIMSHKNRGYFERVLAYIPPVYGDIIWDDYYAIGKREPQSPFRYLLSQEPLRYALWIGIIGTCIYLFWFGRRKQRIIPIVPPITNTTLEFAHTVGTLYFERGNHKNIAEKKITHFLEFIRSRFYMKTNVLDKAFQAELYEKSGIELMNIERLCAHIDAIRQSSTISEESMVSICTSIDDFYHHCGVAATIQH